MDHGRGEAGDMCASRRALTGGKYCVVEPVLGLCRGPLWELDGLIGVDLHRRVRHRNILCCWSERLLELPSRKVRIIDGLFCLRLLLGRVLLRHHRPLGSHGSLRWWKILGCGCFCLHFLWNWSLPGKCRPSGLH